VTPSLGRGVNADVRTVRSPVRVDYVKRHSRGVTEIAGGSPWPPVRRRRPPVDVGHLTLRATISVGPEQLLGVRRLTGQALPRLWPIPDKRVVEPVRSGHRRPTAHIRGMAGGWHRIVLNLVHRPESARKLLNRALLARRPQPSPENRSARPKRETQESLTQGRVATEEPASPPTVHVYVAAVGDAARARMVTTRMWTLNTNTQAGNRTSSQGTTPTVRSSAAAVR
jgi:hypothetical protein